MNKKDIALSVGGVLASMVLAYLLYIKQQQSAAAAAANAAAAADASASQQTDEASLEEQLPSFNFGGGGSTSLSTSNEGDSDTTSSTGTDPDAATEGLLTSIIADFAGSINQPVAGSGSNASIIPTINSGVDLGLVNVPTTPAGFLTTPIASTAPSLPVAHGTSITGTGS